MDVLFRGKPRVDVADGRRVVGRDPAADVSWFIGMAVERQEEEEGGCAMPKSRIFNPLVSVMRCGSIDAVARAVL